MIRLIVALVLLPIVAFAAQAPDSLVVTGPNNAQVPIGNTLVTPTGGIQQKLGDALSSQGINLNGADASGANVTATGTTTTRTAGSRAADVVNVKDYGAVANLAIINSNYTITSGTAALSASSGVFFPAMVGRAIVLPGAGAAGVPLITTILTYTNSTHITLAANASTTLTAATYPVPVGTDNAAAINAAITAAKAKTTVISASGSHIAADVLFPAGEYLVLSGINLTGIGTNTIGISAYGAQIYGATSGTAVVDAMGSRWLRVRGLTIRGDQYAMPTTGLQMGRVGNGVSADNHSFQDILIGGYESVAGFYDASAEQTSFRHLHVFNTQPGAYAAILDGINHFGITSAFTTIATTPNTHQSFLAASFYDVIFQAAGTPLWVSGTERLVFAGESYLLNAAAAGQPSYYGVEIYNIVNQTPLQMLLDVHMEVTGASNLTASIFFTGPSAAPSIVGLEYSDPFSFAGTSVFAADTGITSVKLPGLKLNIGYFNATPSVFDQPTIYSGYGYIDIPNSSFWNGQNFSTIFCTQATNSCTNNTSLPTPLNVGLIQPSGGVTAVTRTNTGSWLVANSAFSPSVTLGAPPAGGTTATASIVSFVLNGYGTTVSAGGTGYTNGNVCSVLDASSNVVFTATITVSAGAVTSFSGSGGTGGVSAIPVGPLAISGCSGGGSGAVASGVNYRTNVAGGIVVTSAGSGYVTPPAVTFSTLNQGVATTATATISNTFSAYGAGVQSLLLSSAGASLGVAGSTGLPMLSLGAMIDNSGVRQTLTATYTVPANTSLVRFIQSGTLAASTVTLPTALADGQSIQFVSYTGVVTALTFSPAVNGWTNASAMAANTGLRIRWDATSAAWFREQ